MTSHAFHHAHLADLCSFCRSDEIPHCFGHIGCSDDECFCDCVRCQVQAVTLDHFDHGRRGGVSAATIVREELERRGEHLPSHQIRDHLDLTGMLAILERKRDALNQAIA